MAWWMHQLMLLCRIHSKKLVQTSSLSILFLKCFLISWERVYNYLFCKGGLRGVFYLGEGVKCCFRQDWMHALETNQFKVVDCSIIVKEKR